MKKLLINARDPNLVRVAILDAEGRLEEIDIEPAGHTSHKGNLYKAQIIRIEPSLGAAFVDFGAERNGFLPLDEVSDSILAVIAPKGRKKGKQKTSAQPHLERGQEVLVQATREPMGTKGAALTTYAALPGRYLVYLPGGDRGGISRKIESQEERSKLSDMLDAVRGKKQVGLILRTAGQDCAKTELKKDFTALDKLWKDMVQAYQEKKGPGLVWREQGAVIRAVRDYYSDDIGEVWVDDAETYEGVLRFFKASLPKGAAERVRLYDDPRPLFSRHNVEEQLGRARQRRVELPSGGSIVIDPTEALVAIDVNSGKLRGEKNIEETALRTNSEAAKEAARQLRLRNLGGIVVIDFIDMRDRKKRAQVERILKEALASDKANITLGKIGRFGTLEFLRQRMRTSGVGAGLAPCTACEGTGRVQAPSAPATVLPAEPREVRVPAWAAPAAASVPQAVVVPAAPQAHGALPPQPPAPAGPSAAPPVPGERAQGQGPGASPAQGGGRRRRRRRRGRRGRWQEGAGSQEQGPADPNRPAQTGTAQPRQVAGSEPPSLPERPAQPPRPQGPQRFAERQGPEPRPQQASRPEQQRYPQRMEGEPSRPAASESALRQWSQQLDSAGQFSREPAGGRAEFQGERRGRPHRGGTDGRGNFRRGGRGGGRSGPPPDDIGNRR